MNGFEEAADLIHILYPEKGTEIEQYMWGFERTLTDSKQTVDSVDLLHGNSSTLFSTSLFCGGTA